MQSNVSLDVLDRMLQSAPVLGDVHPLVPICLNPEIQIFDDPKILIDLIDDQTGNINKQVLVLRANHTLFERFSQITILDHPPIDKINQNLPNHLSYIRNHLLTTHTVASYIEDDVVHRRYKQIVFLLIDGLSYGDVLDWGYSVVPCFVDGPSVTFQTDELGQLIPSIGFASIITNHPITQRLYRLGYHNAFGYSYWQARDNLLTKYMFRGIPDNKVVNFEAILHLLAEEQIQENSYIQVVREGLDGLAHSKRELRTTEVQSAIQAIKDDIERLVQVMQQKSESAVIYITADHGILWKNDHEWKVINQDGSKPRYSTAKPSNDLMAYSVRFNCNEIPYYLYTYPYLGKSIRRNDSGVHGGLSYQESFVPFMKIEV